MSFADSHESSEANEPVQTYAGGPSLLDLRKNGFCSSEGVIISNIMGASGMNPLSEGVEGGVIGVPLLAL